MKFKNFVRKTKDKILVERIEENIESLLIERIKENKELFNEEELTFLKNNIKITKKIYLLGVINGRDVWKKSR